MSAVRRTSQKRSQKGFTLVEILIVVIILGILAAIVIPQFTSASDDARKNSLTSQVQTLRSQVELYKLQHTTDASELFTGTGSAQWTNLLSATGAASGTTTIAASDRKCGPYLQTIPANNITNLSTVTVNTTVNETTTGITPVTGFAYNSTTGKFFALDKNGNVYLGG